MTTALGVYTVFKGGSDVGTTSWTKHDTVTGLFHRKVQVKLDSRVMLLKRPISRNNASFSRAS